MSSVVAVKRHPFFTRRKKRPAKKLAQIGSIPPILTIQTPFDRAWVALQHILERGFSVEQFLCYASSSSAIFPAFHTLNNGSYDVGVAYWLVLVQTAAKKPLDNGVSQALKLAVTKALSLLICR